jgi:hypothetical protein
MRERHIAPFIVLIVLVLFCASLVHAQIPGSTITPPGPVVTISPQPQAQAQTQAAQAQPQMAQVRPIQAETRSVYSGLDFSISFGGSVVTETLASPKAPGSVDYAYTAYAQGGNVIEKVVERKLNGDIPVDTASSDFYVNQIPQGATILIHSTNTLAGHPYTYAYVDLGDGAVYRIRTIIVNSRTVVHVLITFKKSLGITDDEWHAFADSIQFKN